jgi:hypothetical protein
MQRDWMKFGSGARGEVARVQDSIKKNFVPDTKDKMDSTLFAEGIEQHRLLGKVRHERWISTKDFVSRASKVNARHTRQWPYDETSIHHLEPYPGDVKTLKDYVSRNPSDNLHDKVKTTKYFDLSKTLSPSVTKELYRDKTSNRKILHDLKMSQYYSKKGENPEVVFS